MHAIAQAREDLLTAPVLSLLGMVRLRDAEGPLGLTHWDFGGFKFAKGETAAAIGAAAIITAPIEAPTLLVGSAALAVSQGVAFLAGVPGEVARAQEEERFREEFGIAKGDLKWSVVPASSLFWYLAAGDSVLELTLKAKRGPLGFGRNDAKMKRLLERALNLLPQAAVIKAQLLGSAIAKAAAEMGRPPEDFEPAKQQQEALLRRAEAPIQLPPFAVASTKAADEAAGGGASALAAVVVPQEFVCPITVEVMTDPVFTADGMTYERTSIEAWLGERDTSPLTGQVLAHKKLTPNVLLRGMIQDFIEQHPGVAEHQGLSAHSSRK